MLHEPTVPLDLEIRETWEKIASSIKQGRFTPFLGAGASSLRPRELDLTTSPWREVSEALQAMWGVLSNTPESSDEAYLYLRSFTEQRLRISGSELSAILPVTPDRRPVWREWRAVEEWEWPDRDLLEFQCSLLRVGAELGRLFGHAFATHYPPVDQLSACKVVIDPKPSPQSAYVNQLFDAVDRASALSEDSFPKIGGWMARDLRPRLKVHKIRRKLLILTLELTNDDIRRSDEYRVWRRRHQAVVLPEEVEHRRDSDEMAIWLAMLQWLSDLLWYTLRYWMPCYPTTAELAFELSLAAHHALPRRAELAQAAEALYMPTREVIKHLKPLFLYCGRAAQRPSDFHLAVAAALQHMFAGYLLKLRARSSLRPAAEPFEDRAQPGHMPVAFTTNFDDALERAFESLGLPYHVVYPVRVVSEGPNQNKLEWVLRTEAQGQDPGYDSPKFCKEGLPGELIGPVIVKLHGSPLDRAPSGHEHWLVLSETGYLEAMDSTLNPLPVWVEAQLRGSADGPGRSLWFLGYSVSDWNIRLRLYEHLRHSRYAAPQLEKSVVDRRKSLDWFRVAIFGNLDIKVYVGDLTRLPRIISDALSRVERGNEVERILNALGEG